MRIFYFLFLTIIFASCDHPRKPYIEELSWPKRTVKLDNDLGVLKIRLPEEFDTFYSFRFYSAHTCHNYQINRFQSSLFPIFLDSINPIQVDSLKFFTIYSSNCPENEHADSNWISWSGPKYLETWRLLDKSKKPELYNIDSISIKDRTFYTISWQDGFFAELKNTAPLKSQRLYAFTRVNKKYILHFYFNCATSDCDSFIPKMYKALKTVQIKPN